MRTSGYYNALSPAWSPDGSKIAFDRAGQVYTMGSNGSSPTVLTTNLRAY